MAVTGGKLKEISRSGAGGWALLAALFLMCFLLVSSGREEKGNKTDLEIRMESVMEKVMGAGEAYVCINSENGTVKGVVIMCEGAQDIGVRLRVQEAAKALLDIDNARIHVMPMEESDK
ncbi:MAG: hypothetical protein IIX93_04540 [Clostridia bacterium]|nr:hypothetical protein [Clostridia bacterium]